MIKTYLVSPEKNTANASDLGNSNCLREFLEYKRIKFEQLPWRIVQVDRRRDEQHYLINSRDLNLEEKLGQGGFIILNTSGFAHSRTYFFQRALNIPHRIHIGFDSHADLWSGKPDQIGSDGFNAQLMQLKGVDYGLFMGIVPNENLLPRGQSKKEIKQTLNKMNMVFVDSVEGLNSDKEPWMKDTYHKIKQAFPDLSDDGLIGIPKGANLKGRPAYLTIDLDVIRDYPTLWKGHGRMNEEILNQLVKRIGKRYAIVGADICGVDIRYLSDTKPLESLVRIYKNLKSVMRSS